MPMHEYQKQMYKKIGVAMALVILPVVGFFVGMHYQKQMTPQANQPAGLTNGPRKMMQGGMIGEVKAISDTSITITNPMNDEDKTYTITSDTAYKDGPSDATAADIKVGENVLLTLDTSDKTKVKTITINPATMMRGGDSGPSGGGMMVQ